MGIEPDYYLNEMSMDEVIAILKARHKENESNSQEAWEQTRIISFFGGLGHKGTPNKLFPLPWDKKSKKTSAVMTKEDAMKRYQQMKRRRDG